MKRLTSIEMVAICKQYKYVGFRESGGYLMAYNCGLINLPLLKQQVAEDPNKESGYIGYYPISFQEYISIKHPFIIT